MDAALHQAAAGDGRVRPPVLEPGHTFQSVNAAVADIVLTRPVTNGWMFGLAVGLALLGLLMFTILKLVTTGIGIWGNNVPVGWAFDIINFV